MLKVLGKEWGFTKMEIKKKRRNDEDIDLKLLREELCQECDEMKMARKKTNKNLDISEDSSEEDEPEGNALNAMLKSSKIFMNKANPNVAFLTIENGMFAQPAPTTTQTNMQSFFNNKRVKELRRFCGEQGHLLENCPVKL